MRKMNLRGSQTLEASIVVTLLICLMIFLLYYTFYFYNRSALQEISRTELILILKEIHTKEDLEKKIKENLYFMDLISVDYKVTDEKAVLYVQAEWAGKKIPFFQSDWLTGTIEVSSELDHLSGTDYVRRRSLIEFGE